MPTFLYHPQQGRRQLFVPGEGSHSKKWEKIRKKRRKMAEKRNQIKVKYHKASEHSHTHTFVWWGNLNPKLTHG